MKILFVYNPGSGSARSRTELEKMLSSQNIHVDEWIKLDDNFTQRLETLTKKPAKVFVLGGDGTMRAVASELIHTNSIMVPLPGGTLNHFAQDLGLPSDLEECIKNIASWRTYTIDVASVNGHYFVNNSSIGAYARSLETRDELEKAITKWPAAAWATSKELIRFKVYRVTIDEKNYRTPLLFVGNNHYSLDAGRLGKRAELDRGSLSLYVTEAHSRFSMLTIALGLLLGRKTKLVELKEKECSIKLRQKTVTVSLDGEKTLLTSPLTYKIHPQALSVSRPPVRSK